jgi:hypothetical protein
MWFQVLVLTTGAAVGTLTLLGQYTAANFGATSDDFRYADHRSAVVELCDTDAVAHASLIGRG